VRLKRGLPSPGFFVTVDSKEVKLDREEAIASAPFVPDLALCGAPALDQKGRCIVPLQGPSQGEQASSLMFQVWCYEALQIWRSPAGRKKAMRNKIWAWVIFLACCLVLSLGATAHSGLANGALIGLRLTLLAVLSVLTMREWWRRRQDPAGRWQGRRADAGDRILQRWRDWYYGDAKKPH
jgi:hypothetical protein